ncbi:tyrosine-type recombinase/integrase [Rhodococcus sp. BP22]|uniref:tyrosine-type recombinase/integrase n=1 Tax=Rhodococcus sp. BP22 TaxID=2758566 RepID=UPI0028F7150D|nr:tyrosine-type recombinase/integrase [Rhodococcus sp. BP22]
MPGTQTVNASLRPDGVKDRPARGTMLFESSSGTLRDPDTVARQWRQVGATLGSDWVTSHTFRKTVAAILDDEGLSARVAADQLSHAQVSMTQDGISVGVGFIRLRGWRDVESVQ